MRQYVICLIFLQLCGSEYVDYSDYHPENIPLQNNIPSLQSDNPSSEYKTVMRNLCDNWQSPISYLKKRGYMPARDGDGIKHNEHTKKREEEKDTDNEDENYFFFPRNAPQSSNTQERENMQERENAKQKEYTQQRANALDRDENEKYESGGETTDTPIPETSAEVVKNNSTGIINKVKDKFLNLFSHKGDDTANDKKDGGNLFDWNYDVDDPELSDNSNDYEVSERKMFVRSASPPPGSGILDNLSDTDLQYVKSFINCFKQSRKDFKIEQLPDGDITTSKTNESTSTPKTNVSSTTLKTNVSSKPGELTPYGIKLNDTKLNETNPIESKSNETKPINTKPIEGKLNETKSNETKPGESKPTDDTEKSKEGKIPSTPKVDVLNVTDSSTEKSKDGKIPTTPKSDVTNTTIECIEPKAPVATTPVFNAISSTTTSAPRISSSTQTAANGPLDDFTVDLDINQKNGTGEETHLVESSTFAEPDLSTSIDIVDTSPENIKYIIKSMFLAHLHHKADDVGKPLHKPLDLKKVQEIIDKSKHTPTVIMGDGKNKECAPLRLNDMSFDLEWNKVSADRGRDKTNILDFPYVSEPVVGQGLAAKFLQDVNSYNKDEGRYIKAPFGDNFLDSQQTLPDDFHLPLKISTKREAVLPSKNHNNKFSKLLSDITSLPDPVGNDDSDYYNDDSAQPARRRIKGRLRSRAKMKSQTKHRGGSSSKTPSDYADVDLMVEDSDDVNMKRGNTFNDFDELRDIQFRVNDDDEEAISKFISNLNSPPEVFSFDVDKYLRSAELDMEPQAPGLEYLPSEEPRTFYEFMEAPELDKEQLPLIDAQSDIEEEPQVDITARSSLEKRDLLRQYIKGVSNALSHNLQDLSDMECSKPEDIKFQRSPNLDSDMSFRTNNLIDGFSGNLEAMNYIKSNGNDDFLDIKPDESDDFLDNFYLLNDGSSQIYDLAKQDQSLTPSEMYSPKSLEIDLDLDKKFRDLSIGTYNNYDNINTDRFEQSPAELAVKSDAVVADSNPITARSGFESVIDPY